MQLDVSRDFLEAIGLQQPGSREGKGEVKANGQLQFLPSSPDGTLHTAIVQFTLTLDGAKQPFAQGAWRFLFTSDGTFDPKSDPQNPFFGSLMVVGMGKIMAQLNNLCMHGNLPLVPFEPQRLVQNARAQQPSA